MKLTRKISGAAIAAMMLTAPVHAQDAVNFPTDTVTIVVPTAPGSGSDGAARLIAEAMGAKWGRAVIVENVPGAGTTLGALKVAQAAPDGHTLLISTVSSIGLAPLVRETLGYALSDFELVSQVNNSTAALVVNPEKIEARTLVELVEELKANPGRFNYGAVGAGTINHLFMELLMKQTGTEAVLVPYASGGEVLTGLLGGHIELAFNSLASALPHIQSGALVALAVTLPARDPNLPDVPTIHEVFSSIPPISPWAGISAPAGTPRDIVDKISADLAEYLKSEKGIEDMKSVGGSMAVGSTPEEFAEAVRIENETWAEIIRERGITIE